jgi:hypothetical protein
MADSNGRLFDGMLHPQEPANEAAPLPALPDRSPSAPLCAASLPARAEPFAGAYAITASPIGEGIWLVRGADEAIAFANGGAIANAVILSCPEGGAILFDCGPSLRYAQGLAALARKLCRRPGPPRSISHLHPDHALGAGAFDPAILAALPATRTDLAADGEGFPMRCTASSPTGCAAPIWRCRALPSAPARSPWAGASSPRSRFRAIPMPISC